MMDRSPRAPVLRSIAFMAMAPSASSATVRIPTPSISNNPFHLSVNTKQTDLCPVFEVVGDTFIQAMHSVFEYAQPAFG